MAIFGALKKPSTFGQVPGMVQPRMQSNIFGQEGAMQPNTMTKKPGFFGQGGAGRAIAGTIGDILMQYGGLQPIYGPNVLQQRDAEERQRMAEQKRMQDREDFLFQEGYKRANPMPVNNDTVNDLNWYKGLSEEDRKLYHQMKPVTGLRADGTPYAYNPYELNQPRPSGPKPGTIEDGHEFLGGDPSDPKSWRPITGGGGSNVTGGFRP